MPKQGPASLSDRINRIEGQIKSVKAMLQVGDKSSKDIVIQIQAVVSALESVKLELIKQEIKDSLINNIDEVLKLVK